MASFVAAKNAVTYVNGYDLTTNLNSYQAGALELASEEVQTFGTNSIARLPTLGDSKSTFSGFYDEDPGLSHDYAVAALGNQSLESQFIVLPEGDTFDDVAWCFQSRKASVTYDGPHDGIVKISGEMVGDHGFEFAKILHVKTDEAASFDGTTQDNGAGTTAGGVGFLQVFTESGTTLDVIIEESTSGAFAGEETTLLTFTQVVAARTTERIEVDGTVDRYLRASGTIVGGNFEVFVAFHRS